MTIFPCVETICKDWKDWLFFSDAQISTEDQKAHKETGKHGQIKGLKKKKPPEPDPKETETYELSDKKFKTAITMILNELKEKTDN